MNTNRTVILIPDFSVNNQPRLALAYVIAEMHQMNQVDSAERTLMKVFNFDEKYKEFISSNQFTDKEKTVQFFLDYHQKIIFADNTTIIFTNLTIDQIDIIKFCLKKVDGNIDFLIIVVSSGKL